jgi:hypothetical protein
MVDHADVLDRIRRLMEEEQRLRAEHGDGHAMTRPERERLQLLETELDRCWDLLRRRRARAEFGLDPDAAGTRDPDTVEHYLQ